MITAEFAVALPAVTVVLALCLGAASTGVAQIKVGVRANGSRAAARGDSRRRFAPPSVASIRAEVQISVSPDGRF